MTLIPQPVTPNLNQISTNDFINYKGVDYPITNVVSTGNSGGNVYSAVVQISVVTSNDTTLSLKSSDTIVSNFNIDQGGTQHTYWSQSANA